MTAAPLLPLVIVAALSVLACSEDSVAPAGGNGGAPTGTLSGGEGGATTNSGGSDTGGSPATGGAGGSWTPPDGEPIVATDLEWTWIDFPQAKCRDGSSTGIGVNLNSASTEVMIYLQGGGACFNPVTCDANRASYGEAAFDPPLEGAFDRDDPDNPVADFNFVYVPYCSGDLHAGNNPTANVPEVGPQQFVGYVNIHHILQRVVPTFVDATLVLLTGSSAGGYGATANAGQVMGTFGPVPVYLLNDSGPPLGEQYLTPCLQQLWRDLWRMDLTVLAACGTDCPTDDDFFVDWAVHLANDYPTRPFGLISTRRDWVVRAYLGLGENECQSNLPMGPLKFESGLEELKATLTARAPNFATFYIPGNAHTFVQQPAFYTTAVNGTTLPEWVAAILGGTASHEPP